MRIVDLVIAGNGSGARVVASGALRRGQRVLVVLRSADTRVARRLRKWCRETARTDAGQLSVMTDAEVVCVDGVDAVEAVVVRYSRSGRLSAVNASAFVSFDASSQSRRALSANAKKPRSV